jgi:hypothetical protein
MSDMMTFLGAYAAASDEPTFAEGLSLRAKALVVIGLSLAAWVPLLLPVFLIFHR